MLKFKLMKRRSTTPVSKSRASKKGSLVAAAILMSASTPLALSTTRVHADSFDTQMSALQSQINQYQSQANTLQAQANTLQNQIGVLQAQANALQDQINLSQTKLDQLNQQIADTEKKIQDSKDALGATLANMYVDNSISPLEMLASSSNVGDYLDKQSYRSSMTDQLQQTIATINALKDSLTKDKAQVESVLAQQNAQKNSLAATQAQQQQLLQETQGQEAQYQQLVTASQQKLQAVADQQRAYYQSLLASSGGNASAGVSGSFQWANLYPADGGYSCGGGYPYCSSPDTMVDPWGLYNRECVSYVAWALQARFGKYVGSFNGAGNAEQWPSSAPAYSGATRVYDPQPGDAAILPASGFAPIGHAMIVESVSGGWIHVSQYNMYGAHGYSTMDIKNSGVIFLRFPSR